MRRALCQHLLHAPKPTSTAAATAAAGSIAGPQTNANAKPTAGHVQILVQRQQPRLRPGLLAAVADKAAYHTLQLLESFVTSPIFQKRCMPLFGGTSTQDNCCTSSPPHKNVKKHLHNKTFAHHSQRKGSRPRPGSHNTVAHCCHRFYNCSTTTPTTRSLIRPRSLSPPRHAPAATCCCVQSSFAGKGMRFSLWHCLCGCEYCSLCPLDRTRNARHSRAEHRVHRSPQLSANLSRATRLRAHRYYVYIRTPRNNVTGHLTLYTSTTALQRRKKKQAAALAVLPPSCARKPPAATNVYDACTIHVRCMSSLAVRAQQTVPRLEGCNALLPVLGAATARPAAAVAATSQKQG